MVSFWFPFGVLLVSFQPQLSKFTIKGSDSYFAAPPVSRGPVTRSTHVAHGASAGAVFRRGSAARLAPGHGRGAPGETRCERGAPRWARFGCVLRWVCSQNRKKTRCSTVGAPEKKHGNKGAFKKETFLFWRFLCKSQVPRQYPFPVP